MMKRGQFMSMELCIIVIDVKNNLTLGSLKYYIGVLKKGV